MEQKTMNALRSGDRSPLYRSDAVVCTSLHRGRCWPRVSPLFEQGEACTGHRSTGAPPCMSFSRSLWFSAQNASPVPKPGFLRDDQRCAVVSSSSDGSGARHWRSSKKSSFVFSESGNFQQVEALRGQPCLPQRLECGTEPSRGKGELNNPVLIPSKSVFSWNLRSRTVSSLRID